MGALLLQVFGLVGGTVAAVLTFGVIPGLLGGLSVTAVYVGAALDAAGKGR